MAKNIENEKENKVLEGEVLDENGNESEAAAEQSDPKPANDPKNDDKEDKDKEFFLWRGAKAVGRGIVKTGKAVGGFIKKHPYVSSGISAGLGFAAKYGIDFIINNRSSSEDAPAEDQTEETQLLPEPDADIELSFDEPDIDIDEVSEKNETEE